MCDFFIVVFTHCAPPPSIYRKQFSNKKPFERWHEIPKESTWILMISLVFSWPFQRLFVQAFILSLGNFGIERVGRRSLLSKAQRETTIPMISSLLYWRGLSPLFAEKPCRNVHINKGLLPTYHTIYSHVWLIEFLMFGRTFRHPPRPNLSKKPNDFQCYLR